MAASNTPAPSTISVPAKLAYMMLRHRRAIFRTSTNRNKSLPSSTADGAFASHVGSRSHGDSNVGFEQRGRVVDAVAQHDHVVALELNVPHPFHLFFWKQLGPNLVDAQFPADGLADLLAVPGKQDRSASHGL